MDKNKIIVSSKIAGIEAQMARPDFWNDKDAAQSTIQKYQDLKDELEGVGKYDKKPARIAILAGAGGTDAEDFARMLFEMYVGYAKNQSLQIDLEHENQNDQGGYRNITFILSGKTAFKDLQYESGVHRLVRISPFNAQQKRHTAFAMVEVTPVLDELVDFELSDDDLEIEFTKASGPGGQNVNKRETAVRITHTPTGISVISSKERDQARNRDAAMKLLYGKLFKLLQEQQAEREGDMRISKTVANEWGSQIRSYVLHPYQLVKDHRSNFEERNVDKVLSGEIQDIIDSVANLS